MDEDVSHQPLTRVHGNEHLSAMIDRQASAQDWHKRCTDPGVIVSRQVACDVCD